MIALLSGAGHRSRFRDGRRRIRRLLGSAAGTAAAVVRRVPMPTGVRRVLARLFVWRRGTAWVPLERVLLGGQNGLSAGAFAEAHHDLLWPSRRVSEGPHTDLLRAAAGHTVTEQEILASAYAVLGRDCIAATGEFFSAVDDAGIIEIASDFLTRDTAPRHRAPGPRRRHQSDPRDPVLLAPIRDSNCYQVVDGHHRLAAGVIDGAIGVRARIRRTSVSTPLQDLLEKMSWIGGGHELYQPISSPELDDSWTTVRRCTDRLASMDSVLADIGLEPGSSYLDVASCYGWFVRAMGDRGYRAEGVERDPLAPGLGAAVYGLDPSVVHTGDAVGYLEDAEDRWDVVSCFSLLHHFVLGRGSVDAVALMKLLDGATARVLFIDTGQAHEAWFRNSLADWDTARVRQFLETEGTFDRVVDLGADSDAVAPYEENYGRHLFACIRDAT